ncbi:hypothetical protein BCY91_12645 [Pelobium manganitolerans]|uniref:Glycan metabolism protein RagB n=1 Tax=Pelobium manganitolerans TaxID=1842495 RepID=A0A419S1X1_9SPHI|nr:RagB/SusD family nutrient uptake outer membrane protein [Pelobium manganitolerans]RKD12486.1 hypothetical protein BCY91_12645 [Pelobium manganitolerans]
MKTIFTYALISIAMLLASCEKFLDEKPDKTLVSPQTLADLQGLLDDATVMNLKASPEYMQGACDDFFIPDDKLATRPELFVEAYKWEKVRLIYPNDWSAGYAAVYNANLALETLPKIERTNANGIAYDNVKGAALFYRSYYFTGLLFNYALAYDEATAATDKGIVLRLNADFNTPSKRSTVAESYVQIISDLKTAIPLLPPTPVFKTQPSKPAAYALLSRIYLSMRKYQEAGIYADSCLQLNANLMNFNGDDDMKAITTAAPFKAYNKETLFYSEMASYLNLQATSRACIDTLLYPTYRTNDLRKTAFFKAVAPYVAFKGNYTGSATIYFSGLATDEMYLNKAEALVRVNKKDDALLLLNQLLKTRWKSSVTYVPLQASTDAEALALILLERRKELLYRGLRWMDIKRLNKEGANITLQRQIFGQLYSLPANSPKYALPIPDDIIEMTGIAQNDW